MNRRRRNTSVGVAVAEPVDDASATIVRSNVRRTAAQVEKKRLQDRESQRNVRQRTRDYVASLEARLAELELPNCTQQLLAKNAKLEARVKALECVLSSISDLTKIRDDTLDEDVTLASSSPPMQMQPSPKSHNQSSPEQDILIPGTESADSANTITVQAPISSFSPSCYEEGTIQYKHLGSGGGLSPTTGSESDGVAGIAQLSRELDLQINCLNTHDEDSYDLNFALPDGLRDKTDASISMDSAGSVTQDARSVEASQSQNNGTDLDTDMQILDYHFEHSSIFLRPQHSAYDSFDLSLSNEFFMPILGDSALVQAQRSNLPQVDLDNSESAPGRGFLPQRSVAPVNYTVLSQHCSPTNIWDFKLNSHITQLRSNPLPGHSFSNFDSRGPDVTAFLDAELFRPFCDVTTSFLASSINQWNMRIPEKLGLFWLHYIYLKYRVTPTLRNAQQLPQWFTPRASQCMVSHPVWVDTLPWPHLRDKMTFDYASFPLERFAPQFCAALDLNWHGDDGSTYNTSPNGTKSLTPSFIAHLKKLDNWRLTSRFADALPELAGQVNIVPT